MDDFLIYTNAMANLHLGDVEHRRYRKARDKAIAEVAELRTKLAVYEEEVPAKFREISNTALRMSARMDALEQIAEAAQTFNEYFDCIMPEFDDDEYVGEVGFPAVNFRELRRAFEWLAQVEKSIAKGKS